MTGKYALIIGNTDYIDPGLAQLTAPGKDVEDFARVLKDPGICAFDDVKVLLNQPESIARGVIDEFFDLRKPDDLLLFYFSGHGIKDEFNSLYLAFTTTTRSRLRSTALKSDYIREAMDQSRSRRQIAILDCCNSGAFPQGVKASPGGTMGIVSAFQGRGRFVLTASDSTQFAWVGDQVIGETQNSLFTHFLLKGLEGEADNDGDGIITVDELYDYAHDEIAQLTPKQTPTKSVSVQEGEIVLRQITRLEDIKPLDLPDDLASEIEDIRPLVREGAVQRLARMLNGKNIGLRRSALDALEKIIADENTTRRVAQLATQAVETYREVEQKAEAERKAKEETERLAIRRAEEERLAAENAEAERIAKEETDRLARQKMEEERLAREKAEAERLAREEADRRTREESERLLAQKAEEERLAKAKAEADRKARAEARRKAKAEADRKAKEDADRLAAQKAEEERIAQQKAEEERLAKAEADREARAETRRKAKAEADRKAKEDADRLAAQRAEEERLAKVKAEKESKAQTERLATQKADVERKAKEKIVSSEVKATPRTEPLSKGIAIGVFAVVAVVLLAIAGLAINAFLNGIGQVATEPPSGSNPVTEAPGSTAAPLIANPPASPTSVPPIQHGTLRVNAGTFPDTLDPQKTAFINDIGHLNKIYEGLTKLNANLETVPAAAESWEYNSDATQLTFKLREGLKYSDGSVLNAQRFAYSIKRTIDPSTVADYAAILFEISGAPEWNGGDNSAKQTVDQSVEASHADGTACSGYEDLDCNTLTLKFSRPAPYFVSVMSLWIVYPAKQEIIESGGENWWTVPKNQVGNGPWILTMLNAAASSTFASNPGYYEGEPYYDIEVKYIEDYAQAFEAYKNNELDVVPSGADQITEINANAALKSEHVTYPGSCTSAIKFNLHATWNGKKNPFSDKKVREAFALAFDAEGWTQDVDGGLSSPTWTWIPYGYPGYDANSPLKYDVGAAQAALAESSYGGADALNALGLKYTFSDSPRNRQRAEWIIANYQKNLGVNIELDPIDSTAYNSLLNEPDNFPLFYRTGWCADYPDPQTWLSVYWRSDTSFAYRVGYNNPEFDDLVYQGDATLDAEIRADLYKQAQQLLLSDIPAAFGYNNLNHYLVKPWVKGIQTTPQDALYPGDVNPTLIYIDVTLLP